LAFVDKALEERRKKVNKETSQHKKHPIILLVEERETTEIARSAFSLRLQPFAIEVGWYAGGWDWTSPEM
jgi:hypothetical protein